MGTWGGGALEGLSCHQRHAPPAGDCPWLPERVRAWEARRGTGQQWTSATVSAVGKSPGLRLPRNSSGSHPAHAQWLGEPGSRACSVTPFLPSQGRAARAPQSQKLRVGGVQGLRRDGRTQFLSGVTLSTATRGRDVTHCLRAGVPAERGLRAPGRPRRGPGGRRALYSPGLLSLLGGLLCLGAPGTEDKACVSQGPLRKRAPRRSPPLQLSYDARVKAGVPSPPVPTEMETGCAVRRQAAEHVRSLPAM